MGSVLNSLKAGALRNYHRFSTWRAWHAANVHDDVGAVELPGPVGPIGGHLYRGAEAADRPLILYFHGGGWVIGDLQTHHAYCSALSRASGASVIAIDYRRAPEHPFPAAQDDCLAAATLLAERHSDFGPDNGRIVLAGDSAGGQLALCTALEAPDTLRRSLGGLLLTYPVVDHYSQPYASYTDCATGQTLSSALMRWFWDTYLAGADPAATATQRGFPIRSAQIAGLPPVILCTAGRDPLRDEGMAMVESLLDAGVPVDYAHYGDAEHGFACTMGPGQDYEDWLERCAAWIRDREVPRAG
ncbi:MAG: alpha/beta hydrolase [Halieaceae bacterium]|nr:alpha/beta hydrolase [Halieaceae bacterium]